MKKCGFTLAEVLITLVIIGVIAAITVPTLMNNTQGQEYKAALKKAISASNQVITLHYATTGEGFREEGNYSANDPLNAVDIFMQHMDMVPLEERTPDAYDGFPGEVCHPGAVAATNDGIIYCLDPYNWAVGSDDDPNGPCNIDNTVPCVNDISKPNMYIDVNGEKKPNIMGRDVFWFWVKKDGLYPGGCDEEHCVGTNGAGCACKVLREGAMNY